MIARYLTVPFVPLVLLACTGESLEQAGARYEASKKAEKLSAYNALPRVSAELKGESPASSPSGSAELHVQAFFDKNLVWVQGSRRTRIRPDPVVASCEAENSYLTAKLKTEAVLVVPTFGNLTEDIKITCSHDGKEITRSIGYYNIPERKIETIRKRLSGSLPDETRIKLESQLDELLRRDVSQDEYIFENWLAKSFDFKN